MCILVFRFYSCSVSVNEESIERIFMSSYRSVVQVIIKKLRIARTDNYFSEYNQGRVNPGTWNEKLFCF